MKRRLKENIEIGDRVFAPRDQYEGTVIDIDGNEVLVDGPFGEEYHNLNDLEKLGGYYKEDDKTPDFFNKYFTESSLKRKKIIRLTESDLTRIVKRTIMEMEEDKSSEDGEKFRLSPEHVISSLNHNVDKFIKSEDLDKEESFRRLDYFIQRDLKPIINKAKEKRLWTDEEIDYVIRYLKNAYNYDYYTSKELPQPRENPLMQTRMADRIMSPRRYGNRYGE